ncbi:WxL protein peptidoglycan domain-containing protein [Actinoplanes sp. CA-015351]|uniref:WxL protein peptidoglycan domain-containing protein n=1 Tax=Actinoplanes sp. CA-015351 TaxID=3239897 RepID=UPI003D951EEE
MPRIAAALIALTLVALPTPASAAPAAKSPAENPAKAAKTAKADAAWSVQPSSKTGPGNRPFFTYDLVPGGTVTDYLAVTNLGTAEMTFTVYGSDAFTTASGGYDLLPATREPTDVGSWIELGAKTVTVPARSRADIPFVLKIPENATPGDHAGGIVASITTASADATGNTTRVEQRVGTRLYLRVTGDLHPGLRVDNLHAGYRTGWRPFTGDLELTYTVRNTGNTRITPGQTVTVAGLFGLAADSAHPDALPELLPGAALERTVRVTARPALIRLTASVELSSPDGASAKSTVGVWAWSWYYLLILLLAAAVTWAVRRRRKVQA